MCEAMLDVRGLTVRYGGRNVVDGVDLAVGVGEGHALIGPSGSGKTTTARAIVGLVEPAHGSVRLGGNELTGMSRRSSRHVRHDMQMIFQDPQTSLDPRWRVGRSIAEPIRANRRTRGNRVDELLEQVGLPSGMSGRYPHELSIGQQQRVAIARALAPDPRVLVCDEPVAALDTSVQAQILNLLHDLKSERSLALVLVTHDLAVAAQLCATITVLDAGRVVETGSTVGILTDPKHERAAAMVAAARRLDLIRSR